MSETMASDWMAVAKTDEIPVGKFKEVHASGKNLLVCHTLSGFHVVDDTCTHDDGPLGDGWLEGDAIECPRHGAKFDVCSGRVLCLPAAVPINAYRTTVKGGQVKVNLSEIIPR